MPEISLTDFVDFVIKAGSPKLTKVRELVNRGGYSPAFDFWKTLREHFPQRVLAKSNFAVRKGRCTLAVPATKSSPKTFRPVNSWIARRSIANENADGTRGGHRRLKREKWKVAFWTRTTRGHSSIVSRADKRHHATSSTVIDARRRL